MNDKPQSTSPTKAVNVLLVVIAGVTLIAGVFAWLYTELKPVQIIEKQEEARVEWVDRWMKERGSRLQTWEDRLRRLENLHINDSHVHE